MAGSPAPYPESLIMKAVALERSRPISAEDSLINIELHAPETRHHDLRVGGDGESDR
jgi:hypothetical protein